MKTIGSSLEIHFLNLWFASILSNKDDAKASQCVWFFISDFCDTVVGIFLIFSILRSLTKLSQSVNTLMTSKYFIIKRLPNRRRTIKLNYKIYFLQFILWLTIVAVVSRFVLRI
jgi:hypothetical protein